jgi:ankyrin repeat protein
MAQTRKEKIFRAVDNQDLLMIENLIIQKINFNVTLMDNMTPLGYAVLKRNPDLIATLLKSSDIDVNLGGTFFYAIRHSYMNHDRESQTYQILSLLMNHPSFNIETTNEHQETYLWQACFFSLEPLALDLINKGANINAINLFNDSIENIAKEKNLINVLEVIESLKEKSILEQEVREKINDNKTLKVKI